MTHRDHMLDQLMYFNAYLKKCVIRHIILTWHQEIPNLKEHFRRQTFLTNDELQYVTDELQKVELGLFYLTSIENSKITADGAKCNERGGDYVGKKHICPSIFCASKLGSKIFDSPSFYMIIMLYRK